MIENFYKITKYDGVFKIKRKYHQFPKLELSCAKYSEIFQYKHAIIAELATGGYDFYLPSTKYDPSSHEYQFVDYPVTLVASGISEYVAYHDIFAFTRFSTWFFLSLHNFKLELELDSINTLEKRLSELPRFDWDEGIVPSFKSEFEFLYNNPHDDKTHLAIFHADKDYLICVTQYDVPQNSSGIQINCLGVATKLPGGDGRYFKATYEEGEAWYHGLYHDSYFDRITYGAIQPMNKDDYPPIYSYKNFSGYWKKDHDGYILELVFLSNVYSTSLELCLPCPAKEVQFVKKLPQVESCNEIGYIEGKYFEINPFLPVTLWKITSANDEELFLLVSGNHYITLSLQDFTN